MRITKKGEKNKTQQKNKQKKKDQTNMLCYQKNPKLQELGTVPPIGPHAHQLWFFGSKKGAN